MRDGRGWDVSSSKKLDGVYVCVDCVLDVLCEPEA
jgi:hypothetical protein